MNLILIFVEVPESTKVFHGYGLTEDQIFLAEKCHHRYVNAEDDDIPKDAFDLICQIANGDTPEWLTEFYDSTATDSYPVNINIPDCKIVVCGFYD